MNDYLPSVDWNTIKNALVFGIGLNNTMTIRYYNGEIIKEVKGSLFKMSDKDEEIIIKNAEDFYILGYNEIRFAALNVS